jgi:hypothetical protein
MILHCPHCRVKVARDQKHCVTCRRLMIRRCPACAEDISVLAALCKYCGESVVPVPSAPLAAPETIAPAEIAPPPVPAAPRPEVEFLGDVRHVAWEDRAAGGKLKRWWKTWAALMSPAEFWRRAPVEGGHCKPISFAWFPVAQILTIALPFLFVGAAVANEMAGCPVSEFKIGQGLAFAAIAVLLYPVTYVGVALATWMKAAFWHVPLKVLGGKGTYEGTVRTVAYNSGVHVWHLVPVLGSVVAFVLGTFLNYHAFRNVHALGKGRAALAAALPWIAAAAVVAALLAFGPEIHRQCDQIRLCEEIRIR